MMVALLIAAHGTLSLLAFGRRARAPAREQPPALPAKGSARRGLPEQTASRPVFSSGEVPRAGPHDHDRSRDGYGLAFGRRARDDVVDGGGARVEV